MHSRSIPEGSPSYMAADFWKLTADATEYPNTGVPIETMETWRAHCMSCTRCWMMIVWLSLVHGLEAKKITPGEDPAPPDVSPQIMDAHVKDRQPIPEVCRATPIKILELIL